MLDRQHRTDVKNYDYHRFFSLAVSYFIIVNLPITGNGFVWFFTTLTMPKMHSASGASHNRPNIVPMVFNSPHAPIAISMVVNMAVIMLRAMLKINVAKNRTVP